MNKKWWCEVTKCKDTEATTAVQFHVLGTVLLVCDHCANAIACALDELPDETYNVTILALDEWLADTDEGNLR